MHIGPSARLLFKRKPLGQTIASVEFVALASACRPAAGGRANASAWRLSTAQPLRQAVVFGFLSAIFLPHVIAAHHAGKFFGLSLGYCIE